MPQRYRLPLAAAALTGCVMAGPAAADADRVVASIKPVHSLVSAVMAGVGEPHLMIRGSSSPHTFSLRPSDAAMLQDAEIVFLIGESLETSLAGPIDTLAVNAQVVALSQMEGLVLRPVRKGGAFEDHDHGDHADHGDHEDHEDHGDHDDHESHADHDDHDDHEDHDGHEDHDDHADHDDHEGHEDHADHDDHDGHEDHEDHGDHGDSAFDWHIWLDPENAAAMVHTIADALSEADSGNAATYAANAGDLLLRLEDLTAEIEADVAPARGVPFIVFHDAYGYFEDRFGLTAVGSATVSAEQSPGARRILELREKISESGAACVFAEPQFDSRIIDIIVEDTPARVGILDPLGATIDSGPEAYFTLLRNMAASFRNCLAPEA